MDWMQLTQLIQGLFEGRGEDWKLSWHLLWDRRVSSFLKLLYLIASAMQVSLWIANLFIPDPLPWADEIILNPIVNQMIVNRFFVGLVPQWLVDDYLDYFEGQNRKPEQRRRTRGSNDEGFVRDAEYRMIGQGRDRDD